MNEDFSSLDNALRDFIAQEDHATLILNARSNDIVVPAKMLEAQGRQSEDAVFLLALHPCKDVSQWLDQLMTQLQHQVEAANGLRAGEDLPPWPPLPIECMNSGLAAAKRLRLAADYCAERMPETERPVWVSERPSFLRRV